VSGRLSVRLDDLSNNCDTFHLKLWYTYTLDEYRTPPRVIINQNSPVQIGLMYIYTYVDIILSRFFERQLIVEVNLNNP
jgi:hypothetical protein